MKELLLNYAAYNQWANNRIAAVLKKLPEAQADGETAGASLRKTLYHMWDMESAWYQRLQLVEQVTMPTAQFTGTFAEACDQWLLQSAGLHAWVQQVLPVRLEHVLAYYNRSNQYSKTTVHNALMQLFNHSTYHRGQLVLLLRQAGIAKIPATDYIVFTRSRKI